jgi:sigma-B regulation protein RsbU (phosphoserine phosphatase)
MSAGPLASSPPPVAGSARDDARTLAFLADLSQALAVSIDLDRTLSAAVRRIAGFMHSQAASLFLLDADRGMLECRVCVGPVEMTGLRIALGEGIVGRAVVEDECQIVTDAATDPRVWRGGDEQSGFVTRSLLCVPLRTASGPIGALEIINRDDGGVFDADDAEALRLLAAPTALAINNARMAADLVAQQRLRREFELARRMQESLLPAAGGAGFPVTGINLPAFEISGDFYDHFTLSDGRIGFVVGDVSGKGLDAALLMVRAASLLRWAGKDGLAPDVWLARANEELCATSRDGRFVCALVGYCDREARRVHLAGAGFPPVLLDRDGHFEEFLSGGPPLGILADARFEARDIALDGATLYAYSDGASDVRDAVGRPIGVVGLREFVRRHAALAPEPRLAAVLAELRHLKLVDDTTFLVIETPRAGAPEMLFDARIPAEAGCLCDLRAGLRRALDEFGVAADLRDKLVLAVDEACTNIIRHAYGAQSSGTIHLRLCHDAGVLAFELSDDAPPIDPDKVRPKPLGECRAGGLGVAFIDSVMDDWHIEAQPGERGNRLILHKRLAPRSVT